MNLFRTNVRECQAPSGKHADAIKRIRNRLAKELRHDVLSQPVGTAEEHVSHLARACVLLKYYNQQLEELVDPQDTKAKEESPPDPRFSEECKQEMSPIDAQGA